jgi:hypothetical protein
MDEVRKDKDGMGMNKPKTPQPETPDEVQVRDDFQTPRYATKLLLPFIPEGIETVWECAVGDGRIQDVLNESSVFCWGTDLKDGANFLTDSPPREFQAIVTNPPFSLKEEFYSKCMEYDKPFALLIPADNSIWLWDAIHIHGCERILPRRRIDYLTPSILDIVCRGETFMQYSPVDRKIRFDSKPKNLPRNAWNHEFMFPSIDECPKELLAKWSTSQFHSMWLTRYFNLGSPEIGVELTKEMKLDI